MILGHDFHSEDGYRASLDRGREDPQQPTWRELRLVLASAGISPTDCFFTNFYMGLRQGASTTGRFPGASDVAFVARCGAFLRHQISLQRPKLILTLGAWVPKLASAAIAGLTAWNRATSFAAIDRVGPLQRLELEPGYPVTIAALVHPSFRPASVRHRSYGTKRGDPAEAALVADAVRQAFDAA